MFNGNHSADRNGAGERPVVGQLDAEALDVKQAGCCYQAQADGIPCLHPECVCETCGHSLLQVQVRR